jgi:hypothetical protein
MPFRRTLSFASCRGDSLGGKTHTAKTTGLTNSLMRISALRVRFSASDATRQSLRREGSAGPKELA